MRLTAAVGLGAVLALVLLKRYLPRLPASLMVLLLAALASALLHLADRGVAVIGAVAGGPPTLKVPAVTGADVKALLPAATGIALVAIVGTVSAIRTTTAPGASPPSLRREAAALGAASAASGLLGGFAPMASTSSSLSARGAGARSQLFQLGSAAIILFALVSGGPIVAVLPRAVLAASLIAVSVPRLIDVAEFRRLWHGWRTEGVIALVAALGVVGLGVLQGLLVVVALAAGQLLRSTTYPHDAVLAVASPEEPAHEIEENQLPGSSVLIYRVDAPLFSPTPAGSASGSARWPRPVVLSWGI
jgi:MFS superfamily sulfate permease-like transporter